MKPYYSEPGIEIYRADCREVLPTLGKVDLVLTDPPYGIGLRNGDVDGHRSNRSFEIAGDKSFQIGQYVLDCFGDMPVIAFASPWRPWSGQWRNLIVWDKGGAVGGGGDIKTCLKRSWELIQVARNKPLNGVRSESVLKCPMVPEDTTLHIAAKPVELLVWLIEKFADESDVILDPFMGSGTTLVAAKLLGRRAIGIEIEERYCEIAARRLAQGVLPLHAPAYSKLVEAELSF